MAAIRLQVSMNSGLSPYVATTSSGRTVATLQRPTLPKQPLQLEAEGRQYRIEHGVASNNLVLNDFRYALVDDAGTLASCIAKPATRTMEVDIGDTRYQLVRRNRWWSMHYLLEGSGGRRLGGVIETTGFSLWRRKFQLDAPETLGIPAAMFLFFLAVNSTYR